MFWVANLLLVAGGSFLPADVLAQCSNGDLRISEGTAEHGYLEYCWNNQFGIVCGTFFDDHNAQVACRQLGFQPEGATGVGEYQKRSADAAMYLFYMECEGDESTVSECPILGGPARRMCEGGIGSSFVVARISCGGPGATSAPPCNNGDLRISEGDFRNGYLEYCWNNEFGVVCGETFDNADAQVACRQLGYQSDGAVGRGDYQPRPDSAMMYLYTINCEGSENEILDCDIPEGPENGMLLYENSKSYCRYRAQPGIFYDYHVAKIRCGDSVSRSSSEVWTVVGIAVGVTASGVGLLFAALLVCYTIRKRMPAGSEQNQNSLQDPVYENSSLHDQHQLMLVQNPAYSAATSVKETGHIELLDNPAYGSSVCHKDYENYNV